MLPHFSYRKITFTSFQIQVGKKIGEWLKKGGGGISRRNMLTDNNVKSRRNDDFFANIDFTKIKKFFNDLKG